MTLQQEVGSASWMDSVHGRNLRSLCADRYGDDDETDRSVAEDLSAIVRALRAHVRRVDGRLQWAVSGDQLFHILMDHVAVRLEKPVGSGHLVGPRRKAPVPAGWTEEDEMLWQEWLGSVVFSPDQLDLQVMGGKDLVAWEYATGDWRREMYAYLPYLVCRSREILREIDPRPIQYEEMLPAVDEETGEGRRRR